MGSMEIRDPKREETLPFAESHSFRRRVAPVCGAIPHPDVATRRVAQKRGAGREAGAGKGGRCVSLKEAYFYTLDRSAITPPLHSPCARHVRREGARCAVGEEWEGGATDKGRRRRNGSHKCSYDCNRIAPASLAAGPRAPRANGSDVTPRAWSSGVVCHWERRNDARHQTQLCHRKSRPTSRGRCVPRVSGRAPDVPTSPRGRPRYPASRRPRWSGGVVACGGGMQLGRRDAIGGFCLRAPVVTNPQLRTARGATAKHARAHPPRAHRGCRVPLPV